MFSCKAKSLEISNIKRANVNQLFLALLLTSGLVGLVGNLLLWDLRTLKAMAPVAIACLLIISTFYAVSTIARNVVWGILTVYGLMAILAYWHPPWAIQIGQAIGIFSMVYLGFFLRVNREQILGAFWMALCGAIVVLGCSGAHTFFESPRLINEGMVHRDTLFHASIAAMIKNYGVSSTGLHGLVEIPYHIFSHILVASISLLSGVGVFEAYSVVPWMLFVPILIFSVAATSLILSKDQELNIPIAWGLICVILLVAPEMLGRWAFWNSYLISESFAVGCGLFSLGLIPLFKPKLNIQDCCMALILAVLVTEAKGSLGPIYSGLWMLRLFFLREGRSNYLWLVSISILMGVLWTVYKSASVNVVSPLAFLKTIQTYSFLGKYIALMKESLVLDRQLEISSLFLALASICSFFALHFLFSWVAISDVVKKNGWRRLLTKPCGLYVFGSMVFAIIVAIFFDFPTGSTMYFTLPAFFVALPMVVMQGVESIKNTKLVYLKFFTCRWQFVMGAFAVVLLITGGKHFGRLASSHGEAAPENNPLIESLNFIRNNEPIMSYFRATPTVLSENPVNDCAARPFVYPAISERPWVGVIPEGKPCRYELYGYQRYGLNAAKQTILIEPPLLKGMFLRERVLH